MNNKTLVNPYLYEADLWIHWDNWRLHVRHKPIVAQMAPCSDVDVEQTKIYGVVCVQLIHFSLSDRKDKSIFVTHLIIIIKSEVSTFPIVVIFFLGCMLKVVPFYCVICFTDSINIVMYTSLTTLNIKMPARYILSSVRFEATVCHDDVIKWKHFPPYCPFVMGIHRLPVDFRDRIQWRGASGDEICS